METNALRRGNIVGCLSTDTGFGIVEVVEPNLVHLSNVEDADSSDNIFPIPLTKRWLRVLGFNNSTPDIWTSAQSSILKVELKNNNWFGVLSKSIHIKIETIDELQNLFFALEKVDLSISTTI